MIKIGVPKETYPGETRVALIPANVPNFKKMGAEIIVESGAGEKAGYPDSEYLEKGAQIVKSREEVFSNADVILQVRALGANPVEGKKDIALLKNGQILIGFMEPFLAKDLIEEVAQKGVISFALELLPRTSRAQSMDVLSSMATISGYKAVLIAASYLPKMFPMLTTAAGTILPANVFVIGAGVAGLQAIATARRLGAVVRAYDIRPATKQEVESLGAKFVELGLESQEAEDKRGYAKDMGEEFYRRQREMLTKVVAESDVVISTASVPGKKAPVLITEEMVKGMKPGSVIVDLSAERGGNCELTKPGEIVEKYGVKIIGPVNVPATVPYHASQMYSKNITNFCSLLIKNGEININLNDDILSSTLLTKDGKLTNSIFD
ncbi:Re/Si-specific NAD(P)(+) transhydrogenase subunit alpha [Candidatus Chrysopegis kryptomonas]|uniref:NAD(P) transhydrogenase subunit alpha part 1 n=1 Tax=Candidatus Chryseopegocella kryptomonas TaxID=1633643 RepID=A0A0N7MXH9_9BACT|nr:Re/Si-specific NAD(P)(+) transhydrogenase subunit alpha [Candidatus Chrysopegis kryptomonas]CUT01491.1 NAD(P) transhydrogenase subunit alpha [Candidatus Chrysopegis kryptomonas]